MPRQRPTIIDVARRAGVSAGTVSAVVNERATVRESTRRRVEAVILEMDYRPSRTARQLRSQSRARTRPLIGLVVKEIRNPFYAEVIKGATDAAEVAGAEVYVSSSEGSLERERAILERLLALEVSALIVAPVLNRDTDLGHLFAIQRAGHPLVLLEDVPWIQADVVSLDNRVMAKEATKHLVESGRRFLVHFAGPSYTAHSQDRAQGFRDAFSESDLAFDPSLVVSAGASLSEGYAAAQRFFGPLSPEDYPSGVTCFNDLVAIGVLRALHELNVPVPERTAVVGFDGDPVGEYLPVPLTTVVGENERMGSQALERALAQASGPIEVSRIIVPARLVIRQSSARPPSPIQ